LPARELLLPQRIIVAWKHDDIGVAHERVRLFLAVSLGMIGDLHQETGIIAF